MVTCFFVYDQNNKNIGNNSFLLNFWPFLGKGFPLLKPHLKEGPVKHLEIDEALKNEDVPPTNFLQLRVTSFLSLSFFNNEGDVLVPFGRFLADKNFNKESLLKKNYFTSSDPHHDMLGGGCQVRVVRKTSKPGMLFFTIFACSCRVLSATQNSTCQKCSSKQDTTICQNMSVYHLAERNMPKHATTNMPNHVRIPPVKNI